MTLLDQPNNEIPTLHENWIDYDALKIVKQLQSRGFETYLVGGCVRDLLIGIHPKDFDIATSAHPHEVKRAISNSFIIGKRFRLVLVRRGEKQFEIATFRRNILPEELEQEYPPITGDNYFGTCVEDARRRDFTINGLFYDPGAHKVVDYVSGESDLKINTLRMIGDPKSRIIEDPIRTLRAVRLSHKIKFQIDSDLRKAIYECRGELKKSLLPRRREEYLKILRLNSPILAFYELYDLGILDEILPTLKLIFDDPEKLFIFEAYLNKVPYIGINHQDPAELFSTFIHCFLNAYYLENLPDAATIEADPQINDFLKNELNVFKSEIANYFKALSLFTQLKNIDYFLRKGERRRKAFIFSDGFLLSLKLSQLDYTLSAYETNFWVKMLNSN